MAIAGIGGITNTKTFESACQNTFSSPMRYHTLAPSCGSIHARAHVPVVSDPVRGSHRDGSGIVANGLPICFCHSM